MSEAEPGAQRPEDAGDWTVPVAGPGQWDPREAGDTGQHGEPSWPPPPGGSYQAGHPGRWGGPGSGGPGYGGPGPGGPGYGGPGYGGPGYGVPGYGEPGYGGGKGRSARLRQAATLVAVVLIAAGAGAGISYAVAGPASPSNTASSEPSVPAPSPSVPSFPGGQNPNGSGGQPLQPGSGNQGIQPGSGAPANVSAIAAKVDPALVDINVNFGYQDNTGGAGTGIVLTSTGEVLTNNHVIDGATSISVTDIGNGKTYTGTVVGYDNIHDMAVVQLQGASRLQTASISQSAATVGEPVVAIGNAGGVGGTPSAAGGSVTALDQSITASDSLDGTSEQLSGMVETNADIQAGDSGGSLVSADGQVIAMDTAASSGFSFQSQSSGTQGFAIPISQAIATARQIESGTGTSSIHVGATAFIGVTISASNSSGGGFGGIPGQGSSQSGASISGLVNGGAAQAAGLQQGDVITSLAGQTVDSPSTLSKILIGYHPGNSVELGWTDTAGQSHTTNIVLGSGPPA